MHEFESRPTSWPIQPESLLRHLRVESQEILWLTAQTTGKSLQIVPDSGLSTRAAVRVARANDAHHVLAYNPEYERYLDYLIAHECGHLLRLWSVPAPERFLPSITAGQRRLVNRRLLPEVQERIPLFPAQAVKEVLFIWHAGIVRQVTNYPVDLRIEQWLFQGYPSMHPLQAEALRRQVQEDQVVLVPEIRLFTPRCVHEASAIMNCAFARRVLEILGDSSLALPYASRLSEAANELLSILDGNGENNYRGDVVVINRWAERLGIRDWYAWVRMDELRNGVQGNPKLER